MTFRSFSNLMVMTVILCTVVPRSSYGAFDFVNDELNDPVMVDDFSTDLSKWNVSGEVSISGGELSVGNPGEASASLKDAYRIPLPEAGDFLIVETTARGRAYSTGGHGIGLSNDGGAAAAIKDSTGTTYDAYPSAADRAAGDIRTTLTDFAFGDPDTLRFVYDNRDGTHVVSLYVKKYGEASYTPLQWTDGGAHDGGLVRASNAWSTTDPLTMTYSVLGGTRWLLSDFLRYQTIPEPSSVILLGIGGLVLLHRHRR
ncbi:MAG: PEP-CTERM sorting domain-containing protein [Candidatus Pacebacteria bacterium]|nr:PEP-CTERM sorting domain-containing protein [Candidatus Paceibacterota bacterium]